MDDRVWAAAERAAARYTWYGALLDAAGEVPLLTEDDLARTYYAEPARTPDAGEQVFTTSGTSTGVPKRVLWTAADHERYVGHRADLIRDWVGGAHLTAAADLGTGHASASALEIFGRGGLDGRDIDFTLPIARHVELLRSWRPQLLYTMPMILERIAAAGGLDYVPQRVVVVGDIAPAEWRWAMAARLGIESDCILDVLGSIEVGAIAYSDERAGGYLFHEHIIPEVLATDFPGVPDAGVLVLTSLARDSFPAVRYVTGDVVSGFRRLVVDGQSRLGYRRHLGRIGNELKHGEMLSLHAMSVSIATVAPGIAWSVRREGMEAVLEIEAGAFEPSLADAVRSAIRAAHPEVDQMIRSGLVGDLRVEPASADSRQFKRLAANR